MTASTVYQFRLAPNMWSHQPSLDYESPRSELDNDSYWCISEIVKAEAPVEDYSPIRLAATGDGADVWDAFSVPLTFGLFSKRAIDLLRPCMANYFDFLPVFVNDRPFYFPRVRCRLDCVDLPNCVVKYFSSDPTKIQKFLKYRFDKAKIPDLSFFPIPERQGFRFATEPVKQIVDSARLNGFYFVDAEAVGDTWE